MRHSASRGPLLFALFFLILGVILFWASLHISHSQLRVAHHVVHIAQRWEPWVREAAFVAWGAVLGIMIATIQYLAEQRTSHRDLR